MEAVTVWVPFVGLIRKRSLYSLSCSVNPAPDAWSRDHTTSIITRDHTTSISRDHTESIKPTWQHHINTNTTWPHHVNHPTWPHYLSHPTWPHHIDTTWPHHVNQSHVTTPHRYHVTTPCQSNPRDHSTPIIRRDHTTSIKPTWPHHVDTAWRHHVNQTHVTTLHQSLLRYLPRHWLRRTSLKWPILSPAARETLTQTQRWPHHINHPTWPHHVNADATKTFMVKYPSVLWNWFLGDRKGIWPAENLWHSSPEVLFQCKMEEERLEHIHREKETDMCLTVQDSLAKPPRERSNQSGLLWNKRRRGGSGISLTIRKPSASHASQITTPHLPLLSSRRELSHLGWYSFPILLTAEGRRLSLPRWLITYQDGIPANGHQSRCQQGLANNNFTNLSMKLNTFP